MQLAAYIGLGVYGGTAPIVLINPQVLWPVSWFTSQETIGLPVWVVAFIFGGLCRHLWRTSLPIFSPRGTFP